jgi:hypothetical protein
MDLPKPGTWLRVWWQDADADDEWQKPSEEKPRSIEISCGLYRGLTSDGKLRLPPTVSFRLDTGALSLKMDELEIPIGCVVFVEELPAPTKRPTECHFASNDVELKSQGKNGKRARRTVLAKGQAPVRLRR